MLAGLLEASHQLNPADVSDEVARHASLIGATDVVIYLVDLELKVLVPLNADRERLDIDSTVAGRVFRTEQVMDVEADGGRRLWLPLVDGAERLGVLGLVLAELDEGVMRWCRALATLTAEFVVSKQQYGDIFVRTRRLRPLSVAAEMRWSMLPPLTYSGSDVAIAAALEPAYEIAGDAFDYAVDGDIVHVSIIDAMGHGIEASRIANVALASYRHSRRHGLDLIETFVAMDEIINAEFGDERFVTGQFARLERRTGRLRWLSAGHPRPLLLRNNKVVGELLCEQAMPIGLGDRDAIVAEEALEPGDRVVFFSDGVVEARRAGGEPFGRERLADMIVREAAAGQTPAETMRRIAHALLAHQGGHLDDDASLVLLEWRGSPETDPG